MTAVQPTTFLDQLEAIPPLQAIAQRVLAVAGSQSSSAGDVARVLREDPVIAAKILRVANSPFYGAHGQITQLSRAVTRLGTTAVRNLILGICARNALTANPFGLEEHEILWHHSTAVASACETIATHVRGQCPEEAFVGGLLHDTGQLAMIMLQPADFRALVAQTKDHRYDRSLERERFGIDHSEAGFRILTRWGLPASLCRAAHEHHTLQEDLPAEVAVVVLADVFAHAHVAGYGLDALADHGECAGIAARRLEVCEADCVRLFRKLEQRVKEAAAMLGDRPVGSRVLRPSKTVSEIAWITASGEAPVSISAALLEQHGYKLRWATPTALGREILSDDVVVLDLPVRNGTSSEDLASRLSGQGYHQVVQLYGADDPFRGGRAISPTGVCRVPRLFTAFDFQWALEQIRS